MNLFDEISDDLFRPLTSINKRKYADLIALIWNKCKRMPMYSIEKSTIFDMAEEYFLGLDEQIELDDEEQKETEGNTSDIRSIAVGFIRRLRDTGWLSEKDGEYEEESRLAINYKVVPIIKSFQEVINPSVITYKGKLFKIYSMFEHIAEHGSPYEGVLKEASEDFDNLNQALRILSASIEDHIDALTSGKTPEEVLNFFEKYEEKIVVGSYHRFKTNDNLFYYRTNAIARDTLPQSDREKHILKSVMNALDDVNRRYYGKNGDIRLYIDKSENPELDTEIFVDANYEHFPLRDYTDLWGVMRSVVRDYDKIGKRNKKKDDNHLNKHAMHLIRLFMMAIDILKKGEIITHRVNDLPTLLAIRRGDFMKEDGTFSEEFYELLEEYERRLDEAAATTKLPDNPDMEKVEKFVERINRIAVNEEF